LQVTICPPAAARNAFFDKPHDSYFHRQHAVHLPDKTEDGNFANGLSFADCAFLQVKQRSENGDGSRKKPTPDWVLDDRRLSSVTIRFLEIRATLLKPQPGTKRERLARACELLKTQTATKLIVLDRLCAEYCASKNPARRRELEIQIRNLDATIRLNAQPWLIGAVVKAYFRERLDGCQVAARFGFSPPHVRQLLHRLNSLEKRIRLGRDNQNLRRIAPPSHF
jgi:hypothetical protein